MLKFPGVPYPIHKTSKGFFFIQDGIEQIKSDMIILLLTNPGERCLTGDTKISLANGKETPIAELVDKSAFWVYSYDKESNAILPGKATAFKTLKNAELLMITLDNEEKIKCTPNHLWLLRNGEYCRTDELSIGDSLMPLYKNLNTSKYERIYQPYLKDYRETHLCFVEGKRETGIREVVHHKDLNKYNNEPDNLQWMTCKDHRDLHKIINNAFIEKIKNDPKFKKEWIQKIKNGLTKFYKTHDSSRKGVKLDKNLRKKLSFIKNEFYATQKSEDCKKKISDSLIKYYSKNKHAFLGCKQTEETKEKMRVPRPSMEGNNNSSKRPEVKEKLKEAWIKRREKKQLKNHKVKLIEKLNYKEDCYDLNVEKYHNFALSAGVFVHNCMLPTFGTPLRELLFEPNDPRLIATAREMIAKSLKLWEPRVAITQIDIQNSSDENKDNFGTKESVLLIKILFIDKLQIDKINELKLELPLN